jgi:hypothetical protein
MVVAAGSALGSLTPACNTSVVVEDGDEPDSGTGGTTSGTATGQSTSTGVVPPTSPLVCAPDQDAPGPGDPWGSADQCFSADQLAGYMSGSPDGVGEACDGGVLCPPLEMLDEYESGCSDFAGEPYSVDGQCCYAINCYCCGRPMMVDGQARRASVARRADWSAPASVDVEPLTAEVRAALRDAWLEDALLEHASIASFARFTLQLLALGAPPALVEASQQASLDEVRHARDCFALASRYAKTTLGPSELPLAGALVEATLAEAVTAAIVEGCVGETIASAMAAEQRHVAREPQVSAVLDRIAEDEARHAELAWTFVRWAVEVGGAPIASVARETFAAQARLVHEELKKATARPRPADEVMWSRHGRLAPSEAAAVTRAALVEVIQPCAAALLARHA